MVKLLGDSQGGSHALTIAMASVFYSIFVIAVGLAFPRVRSGYEVEFFDASLSFPEKIARWRAKPTNSLQLMASVLLLSLLVTIVG
jgi:hypothetical protein